MRWGVAVVAVCATACGRVGFDATTIDAQPPRQLALSVTGPVTGPLADFPLPVFLDSLRIDRSRVRVDATDLWFEAANGTLLPHEIESLGEPLVAWVRIPALTTGVTLTVHYGDSSPAPGPASVWSSDFVGVWHLDDAHDSTPNALVPQLLGTSPSPGLVGPARLFDGIDDAILIADAPVLGVDHFTISGWVNLASDPMNYMALIGRQAGTTIFNDLNINAYLGGTATSSMETDQNGAALTNGSFAIGSWAYLACAYDGSAFSMYVDGALVDQTPMTGITVHSSNPMMIGADRNSGALPLMPENDFLHGLIDEVRVEAVGRDANWQAATVRAMRDQLLTYGP